MVYNPILKKVITVKILTKSGRILTFKVVGISDSALKGDNLQVPYTEIVEIKKMLTEREIRQKFRKNAAIGLVVAAAVVVLIVVIQATDWEWGLR